LSPYYYSFFHARICVGLCFGFTAIAVAFGILMIRASVLCDTDFFMYFFLEYGYCLGYIGFFFFSVLVIFLYLFGCF